MNQKNYPLLLLVLLNLPAYLTSQSLDTTLTIHSEILSEERSIRIGLPYGYFESADDYSVLYIMDAEYRYDFCRAAQQYLGISTRIPNSIMIGISNLSRETRNRDLLPSNFGGKDSLFRKFIELELIPFIEKNYRCKRERLLAGHSHGGIFAVNTLLQQPNLFDKYLATDPSFQIINSNLPDTWPADLSQKSLYICSSDGSYGYNEEIASDMYTNNVIFQNHRVQHAASGLRFHAEHIPDDHGNSFMTAFHRGLRWVNNWPISKATLKQ
ncbi:MAG: alpha/beta hydrolase [Cyanothece sp. SIO1E1]|nr:alpha/beta hydrolase [Cyanothece sp. SIO1E1]